MEAAFHLLGSVITKSMMLRKVGLNGQTLYFNPGSSALIRGQVFVVDLVRLIAIC